MKKFLLSLLILCIFIVPFSIKADTGRYGVYAPNNIVKGSNVDYYFSITGSQFTLTINYDTKDLQFIEAEPVLLDIFTAGNDNWFDVQNNNGVLKVTINSEANFPGIVKVTFKTLIAGDIKIDESVTNAKFYYENKLFDMNYPEKVSPVTKVIEPTCEQCPDCNTCDTCKECDNSEINETPLTTWISYVANAFMLLIIVYMIGKLNKKGPF